MDYYTIAEDSPRKAASVDKIDLKPGGDAVKLTKDQVQRLEDAGVKLVTADKPDATTNETEGA